MSLRKSDPQRRANLITIISLLAFMILCVLAAIFVRDSPLLVGVVSVGQVDVEGKVTTATPSLLEALEALESPTPEASMTPEPEITGTPQPGLLVKSIRFVRIIPGYSYLMCGGVALIVILILGGFLLIMPNGRQM